MKRQLIMKTIRLDKLDYDLYKKISEDSYNNCGIKTSVSELIRRDMFKKRIEYALERQNDFVNRHSKKV